MAALHGEISNEKGSKCSRLAHKEVHSHISTWDVAIDCWLDKEGFGRCEVTDHKSGEVLKQISITPKRVFASGVGPERDTSHDDEPYVDLPRIERIGTAHHRW